MKTKEVISGPKRGRRADFRLRYRRLQKPPAGAKADWYQRRGREFEGILVELLKEEGLEPRLRCSLKGEEIDGSFILGGRVFLLEAKWERRRTKASALYQFKGKVDGKLAGTLGIFISMPGYTQDAVDALTVGKDLNVILLDATDIDFCMIKPGGFTMLLLGKLRLAAEEGVIYSGSQIRVVTAARLSETLV